MGIAFDAPIALLLLPPAILFTLLLYLGARRRLCGSCGRGEDERGKHADRHAARQMSHFDSQPQNALIPPNWRYGLPQDHGEWSGQVTRSGLRFEPGHRTQVRGP